MLGSMRMISVCRWYCRLVQNNYSFIYIIMMPACLFVFLDHSIICSLGCIVFSLFPRFWKSFFSVEFNRICICIINWDSISVWISKDEQASLSRWNCLFGHGVILLAVPRDDIEGNAMSLCNLISLSLSVIHLIWRYCDRPITWFQSGRVPVAGDFETRFKDIIWTHKKPALNLFLVSVWSRR